MIIKFFNPQKFQKTWFSLWGGLLLLVSAITKSLLSASGGSLFTSLNSSIFPLPKSPANKFEVWGVSEEFSSVVWFCEGEKLFSSFVSIFVVKIFCCCSFNSRLLSSFCWKSIW